jgi:predicted nucleotidyltransferase
MPDKESLLPGDWLGKARADMQTTEILESDSPIRFSNELGEALVTLCRRFDIALVLLFGSRAMGRAGPSSDIDIGLKPARASWDVEYEIEVWHAFMELFGRADVDVVLLPHASPLLAFHAVTRGQVLYESQPGVFRDFALLTAKRFADATKFLALRKERLRRFLKENAGD